MSRRNPNEKHAVPPPDWVKATLNADGSVTIGGDLPFEFPRRVWLVNDMLIERVHRQYLISAGVKQIPTCISELSSPATGEYMIKRPKTP